MEPRQVAAHWEANAKRWTELARSGHDAFRDGLNSPAFFRMLPPVEGKLGLDVGCGEGANTRQLARSGAYMQAVDIAPTFVRCAQEEECRCPLGICYQVADGMDLPFAADTFDFVTAFMSLMDMADAGKAVREVARVLRPGGFLQFSILHPCFVTPHRKVIRDASGKARAIEVGDYFASTDGRIDQWWFTTLSEEQRAYVKPFRTPIFHRPLSEWLSIVLDAGLAIEALQEPTVGAQSAGDATVIEDTRVAPISLQMRARKK
jgi:ubiquinone/menaquinone biosynthesis C-methylase UbiE